MTYDPNKWCLKCSQRGHSSQACPRVKVMPKPQKQRGFVDKEITPIIWAALVLAVVLLGFIGVKLHVYMIKKGFLEVLENAHTKPLVDGRAYLGEWKGNPVYAKLDAHGGVSITYSSKPMSCPNDPHPNCTYIPAYIDLNQVPK